MIQRQSSSLRSFVPVGIPMPALLHSTCTAPKLSRAVPASASTSSSFETSQVAPTASVPAAVSSATVSSSASWSMSASTSFIPAPANARAIPPSDAAPAARHHRYPTVHILHRNSPRRSRPTLQSGARTPSGVEQSPERLHFVSQLRALGLSHSYGPHPTLVDVTFTVADRDRVGVVGPNGIGKSTLLRLLAGEITPDAGTVERRPSDLTVSLLGQELDTTADESVSELMSRRLGVSAASARSTPARSRSPMGDAWASDRYADVLDLWLRLGGADLDTRLGEALAAVGLPDDVADQPAATLSGGQAARARPRVAARRHRRRPPARRAHQRPRPRRPRLAGGPRDHVTGDLRDRLPRPSVPRPGRDLGRRAATCTP